MTLHGTWNGSASLSPLGFLAVYAMLMIPVFGLLVWLAVWSRSNELRTIRTQLPVYAMAGWIGLPEPVALGSMKARTLARTMARRTHGEAAARTVREYVSFATSLAFLRARATRGAAGPDFAAREHELLHHLWERKSVAQPALTQAAFTIRPPYPAWYPPYGYQQQPYGYPPQQPQWYQQPEPYPQGQGQAQSPYGPHPYRRRH
jgi:hypothetical protein